MVLAALVVLVAVVVVLLGSRSGTSPDDGGRVTVTGAPSAGAPSAPTSGVSPRGAASDGATPSGQVVVHVVGAVERAGVVTLPGGGRVSTAIERAGGATGDADLARLNLARVVEDGERLYVPRIGEAEIPAALDGPANGAAAPGSGPASSPGGAGGQVDLNTADQAALETLPGIGPGLAGRILAWRDEHGRFGAVDDLLDVNGIGEKRLAELRDRVRV